MKRFLLTAAACAIALPLMAQRVVDQDGRVIQVFPYKDHPAVQAQPEARVQLLINHGGPIMPTPQVVSIFWGSKWNSDGAHVQAKTDILMFFANFGSTGEWRTINQYGVNKPVNLTNQSWVDSTNPPNAGVTDAQIQGEVINYFNQGNPVRTDTVYEVFLTSDYYSTLGNATSCGGPHLQYCAYHSNFNYGGQDIKYSSMPFPSCSGCQWPGWSNSQNFEHFACHETREASTDADGTAWFDRSGNEADDKCAWSPSPFIDAGFGYQYEWSNADRKCVQTK
jgi:hypothetical protein